MYMATIVVRVGGGKEAMYTTPLRSKNAGFLQPPGKAYSAGNLIRNGNTDPGRVSGFGEGRSSLPSAWQLPYFMYSWECRPAFLSTLFLTRCAVLY